MDSNIQDRTLTNTELVGYCASSLATMVGMISFMFLSLYWPMVGMNMNLYSTALLVARIFDFFVTLFVGGIMEKVKLTIGGGKYRPWLLVFQFGAYAGMVLLFFDPVPGNETVHFIVVAVASILLNTSSSFIATARFGLVPLLAGSKAENRTRLTTWGYRTMTFTSIFTSASGAYIAAGIGMIFKPPLNYTVMTVCFGLFYLVGIAIVRAIAKPYDIRSEETGGFGAPQVSVSDMVKAVTTNSQLLVLLLCNTLSGIGMMAMMGLMMYYWQLIVPYTHNIPISTSFPGLYTLASTISTIASTVFAMIGPAIGTKIGKRNAIVVGMLGSALSSTLNFFLGARFWAFYIGISMIATFSASVFAGFGINYALDCGEYGLWKTGQDHRLVIMSMTNMPMKISSIIGGSTLYILTAIGFDAVAFGQALGQGQIAPFVDDKFVTSFMALMCLTPAAFNCMAGLLMRFAYKITDADAARYAKENMERMMANAAAFAAPAPAEAEAE